MKKDIDIVKAKQNKKKKLYYFYDHPVIAIFIFLAITIAYFFSFLIDIKQFNTILSNIYVVITSYILSSVELKFINYFGDLLDKYSSKIWDKYKVNSWENLSDIERFYKIGWKDDYLHDLLILFKDKHILPSEQQMDFYIDSSGNVNSILLYELLVSKLQKLSTNELAMLKHYIELKSSKYVYQRNVTINNVGKAILIISTLALILTISGTQEDITVGNITIKNLSTRVIKHTIAQIPVIFIMFSLLILIFITTIFVSIAFYNAKHLRYVDVIHQALADAYFIKANNEVKK
ncbi:hypothetical protein [Limosilactobacillus reuteri]|uniref:hypothetical protein n=1 Tax=Limosilactobacillus reuteri TaxID=1598 RepID=UPI001CDD46AA|nr:hypothetical protein [Limosilactobacillus reuteri]